MAQPSSPFVLTTKVRESSGLGDFGPKDLPSCIERMVSLDLAPISKINVGAVGLGSSSRFLFLGVNVEFPGLPLHHSIHAEQFLVINLMLHSEPQLRYLAVSDDDTVFDAPCGHCRQFLQEIREDIKILIMDKKVDNEVWYESLGKLLPRTFGPGSHIQKDSPALLQRRNNGLTLSDPDSAGGICAEALAAANISYAPYSNCPSGVALKDRDGNVYKGCYMESVAFNPSLGPVQVALVNFLTRTGENLLGFKNIVEAVLVEKKDADVSQEKTARLILETIASTNPKCVLKVLHCIYLKIVSYL